MPTREHAAVEGAVRASAARPPAHARWRCARCGNLTRFDVVRTTRVREFVHLDLSGEPTVEETEVLDESVQTVRCRWCNTDGTVEVVPRADAPSDPRRAEVDSGEPTSA